MKVIPNPEEDGVIIKMSQVELKRFFVTIKCFDLDFHHVIREIYRAIVDYYKSFPKL